MRLRYEQREEVRVVDFNMPMSSTLGIGTEVGEDVHMHRVG
jgi:hypothetical protein